MQRSGPLLHALPATDAVLTRRPIPRGATVRFLIAQSFVILAAIAMGVIWWHSLSTLVGYELATGSSDFALVGATDGKLFYFCSSSSTIRIRGCHVLHQDSKAKAMPPDRWFVMEPMPIQTTFRLASLRYSGGMWPAGIVAFPIWWLIVAMLVLLLLSTWRFVRRAQRTLMGVCAQCGYDLRATPERCPECGTATQSSAVGH